MYVPHDNLTSPSNPIEPIWRYMDFVKFVSLLEKRSLFFCRVDKLGDKNEMAVPAANKKEMEAFYNKHKAKIQEKFSGKLTLELWNNIILLTRHSILVNSWSINEFESAAMWSIYSKTNMGIAIQSTFQNLCESFNTNSDNVNVGIVKYNNYEIEKIEDNTIFGYVSHKLKSYEFEKELRAIITKQTVNSKPKYEIGKYVEVDLNKLIKKIYIAPLAPDWFHELVISTCKKFEFEFKIHKSNLNDENLY